MSGDEMWVNPKSKLLLKQHQIATLGRSIQDYAPTSFRCFIATCGWEEAHVMCAIGKHCYAPFDVELFNASDIFKKIIEKKHLTTWPNLPDSLQKYFSKGCFLKIQMTIFLPELETNIL